MHVTLFAVLAWFALSYTIHGIGASATVLGVVLMGAVFAAIVVHELGHALMARHFGYQTREILLLPVGGVASLEGTPERPGQELAVALVGPAINFAIAGLLWLGLALTGGTTELDAATTAPGAIAAQLLWINVALALFNLLPAFPMDGGRVLRAVLSMQVGRVRATEIAATLGKAIAIVLGTIGVFYNPLLVLMAVVVWIGATQECAQVELRSALTGVPVSAAMLRRVDTISPDQPLEDAAALLLAGGQNQLPVMDRGEPVGVLTRGDVASALAQSGPDAKVSTASHHHVVTVTPGEPLDAVLDRLRQSPDAVALVVDHGAAVGIVTADALAAYAAMHRAA